MSLSLDMRHEYYIYCGSVLIYNTHFWYVIPSIIKFSFFEAM